MNTHSTSKKTPSKEGYLRLKIIFGAFSLLFLIVVLRLFQIQVLNHDKYRVMAEDQYWDIRQLPAQRGNIYTSDGAALASTQMHYLLYAEPKNIENKHEVAHSLATILDELNMLSSREPVDTVVSSSEPKEGEEASSESKEVPSQPEVSTPQPNFQQYYDKILDALSKDLMWVPIEKNLTPPERDAILALNLKGIGFEEEPVRYYSEGTLGAHVLGFVASDEKGNKLGYFGIEGILNDDLRGKPGRVVEETDALGMPILTGGYTRVDPVQGRDTYLTINSAVQYIVEKHLKEGVEKYDALTGTVIVMDPISNEIIAMANYPTYNPSVFNFEEYANEGDRRKTSERRNNAISTIYEPGSVIKPLTVSTAIDLGLVTPETTFEDNGPTQYSDYVINNWDGKHHGTQTIVQLLQKSNNIGSAWVGHQVGEKNLYKYFTDFGLGSKTGVLLEGEDTGQLRDYKTWTDIDLATAAFGQGISATPLQVLNAFNVIANGGILYEPKIVAKIVDHDKTIVLPQKEVKRVISTKTSNIMVDMLEKAVEGGEAKYFVSKDYRIAGKTGTAQIPENGKYSPDRTNATFVGFMVSTRRFSMIVKLEEPKTSTYAAETSVPLWMEIANELVKYYSLPPDKTPVEVSIDPTSVPSSILTE